jgi:hypothetical protein
MYMYGIYMQTRHTCAFCVSRVCIGKAGVLVHICAYVCMLITITGYVYEYCALKTKRVCASVHIYVNLSALCDNYAYIVCEIECVNGAGVCD